MDQSDLDDLVTCYLTTPYGLQEECHERARQRGEISVGSDRVTLDTHEGDTVFKISRRPESTQNQREKRIRDEIPVTRKYLPELVSRHEDDFWQEIERLTDIERRPDHDIVSRFIEDTIVDLSCSEIDEVGRDLEGDEKIADVGQCHLIRESEDFY